MHQSLLTAVLLPLHEPNEMAVWSVQQPLLDIYHEELVGCMVPLLERQPELVLTVYEAVVATWPRGFNSNTPKVCFVLSLALCAYSAVVYHMSSETQSLFDHAVQCCCCDVRVETSFHNY